jgi:hypothetical protein
MSEVYALTGLEERGPFALRREGFPGPRPLDFAVVVEIFWRRSQRRAKRSGLPNGVYLANRFASRNDKMIRELRSRGCRVERLQGSVDQPA